MNKMAGFPVLLTGANNETKNGRNPPAKKDHYLFLPPLY